MKYRALYHSMWYEFEDYESLRFCLNMLGAKGFFGINRNLPSRFRDYLLSSGYVFVERRER